jgi:hypothetical protein
VSYLSIPRSAVPDVEKFFPKILYAVSGQQESKKEHVPERKIKGKIKTYSNTLCSIVQEVVRLREKVSSLLRWFI